MGCLNSKPESSQSPSNRHTENQINLIFQAKKQRANVFNAGIKPDDNFRTKNIHKNDKQKDIIRESFLHRSI